MAIFCRGRVIGGAMSLVLASAATVAQAGPTVEDALRLTPVQKDVEYDRPSASELEGATIKPEQEGNVSGWVVRAANGQVLRKFLDTNADNVVDQWSYFSGGLEVYRDVDSDYNGKADQYRWLNTGGTRWGVDKNEDGRVDQWKMISAEEVTAEAVAAIATRDATRFARLLATPEELQSLGLGENLQGALSTRIAGAQAKFQDYVASLSKSGNVMVSNGGMKWTHFGGSLPGVVPAGTAGLTKDICVYENVVAMVQVGDKHDQVPIGSLLKVGDVWRLIDAPSVSKEGEPIASVNIFGATAAARPDLAGVGAGGESAGEGAATELMRRLEEIDAQIARAATPVEVNRLHTERADVALKLASVGSAEDRQLWMRQLADSVSAAVQNGAFAEGMNLLRTTRDKLSGSEADKELAAYFDFRLLTAEYSVKMQAERPDFVGIQKWWLDSLAEFVTAYPSSGDTAEAMLQLGLAEEFAGQEEKAKQWYAKIASTFSGTPIAKKASGAIVRLDSAGKVISLRGQTLSGSPVDLANFRGKPIVIHYWATWCEPCKADMAQLKELQAKYAREGLTLIGVSLDANQAELDAYLKANKGITWPQLWSPGGLDSQMADQLGILTLPTMLLLDQQGRVANRNIHITEVDKEVGALVR